MIGRVLKRVYNSWGITVKLFFVLLLMPVATFAFFQWSSLGEAKNLMQEQKMEELQGVAFRASQFLDGYLENVKSVLFLISSQTDLFVQGNEKAAEEFLRKYGEYNSSIIKMIYFIRNDNTVLCSKPIEYQTLGNGDLDWIYQRAISGYNGLSWTEPYRSSLSSETVAFTLPVNGHDRNVAGIVMAEINIDYLQQRLSPWLSNLNQSFFIMSNGGNLVANDLNGDVMPYQERVYPKVVSHDFMEQVKKLSKSVSDMEYQHLGKNRSLRVIKSDVNGLAWELVIVLDTQIFKTDFDKLNLRFFVLTFSLGILVLLAGAFLLSYYFTVPIRKFVTKVDNVDNLDNLTSITIDRNDEIGKLSKSYNAMITRIHRLVEEVKSIEIEKKRYELKMLQSQIGPHFLYNTLICIGSLARQQRVQEVRETINSLIGLLSLTFDKSSEYITLEQEIAGINMYAHIQKIRYGDVFDIHTDISSEAMKCHVLKLTLQPLIENAIFHGIIPKQVRGVIKIKARISGNLLRISVRDNGVGLDKEKGKRVLRGEKGEVRRNGLNSMGIFNVHERLRIHFGQKYGLHTSGRKDLGTIIHIIVPLIHETNQ